MKHHNFKTGRWPESKHLLPQSRTCNLKLTIVNIFPPKTIFKHLQNQSFGSFRIVFSVCNLLETLYPWDMAKQRPGRKPQKTILP